MAVAASLRTSHCSTRLVITQSLRRCLAMATLMMLATPFAAQVKSHVVQNPYLAANKKAPENSMTVVGTKHTTPTTVKAKYK
eukprot:5804506-Amphidinium_carterae.1